VVVDGSAQPVFTPFSTFILNWRPTRGAQIDITTNSFYLNDRWTLNNKWSFNLGLRYERVRSEATGNIVSVDTDTIVPRLAATYDVRGDGRFTLQATYGHYAGRYGTYQFAGNTNVGNPSLVYGIYLGPEGSGKGFAPGFDTANYLTVGGFFPTVNVFFAPGLSSPVNREFTAAAGVGLGPGSYAKLTFVNRKLTGFVEDFLTFEGGSTTVEEDGEVLGTFTNQYFENSDLPKRTYKALVLQTAYRLTSRWNVAGHWTLMLKNDGNFEGENAGSPGISSGIGDFAEVFVPERNFPEGRLNGYQRHKVRAWTTYDFALGRAGHANLGLLWRFDSGSVYSLAAGNQPLSDIQLARDPGYDSLPTNQILFFADRGTELFESSSRFDLALNYDVPVYKKLRPWLKLEVRNVFNDQSLIASNTTIDADPDSPLDADGLPTGFVRGSRFGQGTSKNHYPLQRTFLFSVGLRF
jgi:outer membrane receptor protein involved in Fe transport